MCGTLAMFIQLARPSWRSIQIDSRKRDALRLRIASRWQTRTFEATWDRRRLPAAYPIIKTCILIVGPSQHVRPVRAGGCRGAKPEGLAMTKKRSGNAQIEREGILATAAACNRLGLIWRDVLQEDVGVDGTVELTLEAFPTGKLAGVQVKSGKSYIRTETEESFKFCPSAADLDYWRRLTLPLFLVIYDPRSVNLFWLDVQRYMENRPEDPPARHIYCSSRPTRSMRGSSSIWRNTST